MYQVWLKFVDNFENIAPTNWERILLYIVIFVRPFRRVKTFNVFLYEFPTKNNTVMHFINNYNYFSLNPSNPCAHICWLISTRQQLRFYLVNPPTLFLHKFIKRSITLINDSTPTSINFRQGQVKKISYRFTKR